MSRRHLRWGWGGLLAFSLLGVTLEALHAFKVGGYLDVGSEARRLVLRLGHAHGTLVSLVHVAFAFTLGRCAHPPAGGLRLASKALVATTLLLPGGFLLGGLGAASGDPGPGIALVPAGAVTLLVALVFILRELD